MDIKDLVSVSFTHANQFLWYSKMNKAATDGLCFSLWYKHSELSELALTSVKDKKEERKSKFESAQR